MKKVVYPNLKMQMAKHGDTEKVLGELLGVPPSGVHYRLHNNYRWTLDDIILLSDRYGVDIKELFERQ